MPRYKVTLVYEVMVSSPDDDQALMRAEEKMLAEGPDSFIRWQDCDVEEVEAE